VSIITVRCLMVRFGIVVSVRSAITSEQECRKGLEWRGNSATAKTDGKAQKLVRAGFECVYSFEEARLFKKNQVNQLKAATSVL
jgi:hypothetical protein